MARVRLSLVCATVVLLLLSAAVLPARSEASPDRHRWSIVDTPSGEDYVVVNASEINVLVAATADTLYALDIPAEKVYKSTDGGVTWDDEVTDFLVEEGAEMPAWDLAVAPGDPDLIAVVTDARQEVYVSEDGGETWEDTEASGATGWDPGLLIADLAFSPEYDSSRDMALGTRNPDGIAGGDVWVMCSAVFASWTAQELDLDVSSVGFSPDYEDDATILAVASDLDDTYLCTGYRDRDDNTTDWDVTDPEMVRLAELPDESPAEDEIIRSSLAIPSGYSGDDADDRVVYVGYSSNTDADDVYRVEDDEAWRLDIKRGQAVAVASVAYRGGTLVVGEVLADAENGEALLHITSNPSANPPDWEEPSEAPTGGYLSGRANAQVLWAPTGSRLYCGTSTDHVESAANWTDTTPSGAWAGSEFDESALSRSNDEGDTWNQLSLIDTDLDRLSDYAFTLEEDSEKEQEIGALYLGSTGVGLDSVWRSTSAPPGEVWERVLCFDSVDNEVFLRIAEEDPDGLIYLFSRGTHDARYSTDKGESWEEIRRTPAEITDMLVVTDELLYMLEDTLFNRRVWNEDDERWEWDSDIETELGAGLSIFARGEKHVFVGDDGTEGEIAYSDDGGLSFEVMEALPEPGRVLVEPDGDFYANRVIYAATDATMSEIYRWTVGLSREWQQLNPLETGYVGLAHAAGALYGAYGSGVVRTLVPRQEDLEELDWDRLIVDLGDGVEFKFRSLRWLTDDMVQLWALDDREYDFSAEEGCLWIYSDTFVLRTPWPTSPAIGLDLPCDTCDCEAETFCFHWRALPETRKYDLWVAMDEHFDSVLVKVEDLEPTDCDSPSWCSFQMSYRFGCGRTYYWMVRASETCDGEDVRSRWSPPMRFTVREGTTVQQMHIAPILVAPEVGAKGVARSPSFSWVGFPHTDMYEFTLAEDPAFNRVLVRENTAGSAYTYGRKLDWGSSYFWRVRAVEPIRSEYSVGTFTVLPQPRPGPQPKDAATYELRRADGTPLWAWVTIGVLGCLVIVAVALVVRRQ